MELIETLSLIMKFIVAPMILALFTKLWDFKSKQRERLRTDYSFAEQFVAEDRWKSMSDYSLKRAYEALSGIRVEDAVIRFFLSQENSLEKLLNYATGKDFLVTKCEDSNLSVSLTEKFKWLWIKAWSKYIIFGFCSLLPIFFVTQIFSRIESNASNILSLLAFVLCAAVLGYFELKKIVAMSKAKQIHDTLEIQTKEILTYLKNEKQEFAERFNIIKLGLFGSYALNQQTENSDIDLLIEFAPNTDALSEKKAAIKEAIESRFHKKVDLCREKYIKSYFKQQILDSAIYV